MKYKILAHDDAQALAKQVNEQIEKGWEPLGGVGVGRSDYWFIFAQAMIWRDEDEYNNEE